MESAEKIALVTGASRGIGKACVLALADAGFDVAFTARTAKEFAMRVTSVLLVLMTALVMGQSAADLDPEFAARVQHGQRALPLHQAVSIRGEFFVAARLVRGSAS